MTHARNSEPETETPEDRACRTPAKARFEEIYDAPDPRAYFASLRPLDYRTPDHSRPVIRRALAEIRRLRAKRRPTVLDLCSGYGVNGALLKFELGLDDLYRHYALKSGPAAPETDRRRFAARRRTGDPARVIGQDVAGRALAYAEGAGFIDAALHIDLESKPLAPEQARLIADSDLITITGGLSYIGAATLRFVLGALRRPPWVLYFPLRGTDVAALESVLDAAGLVCERWHRPIAHRRFANARERRETRSALIGARADGLGPVSETHQQAALHLARPESEQGAAALADIVRGPRRGGPVAGARPDLRS